MWSKKIDGERVSIQKRNGVWGIEIGNQFTSIGSVPEAIKTFDEIG